MVSSISVCNDTRVNKLDSRDFVNHLYNYRPNWTPLSPISIIDEPKAVIKVERIEMHENASKTPTRSFQRLLPRVA